jgi:hypothetical protein
MEMFLLPVFFRLIPPTAQMNINAPALRRILCLLATLGSARLEGKLCSRRPRGRVIEATDDGRLGIFTDGSFARGRQNDREFVVLSISRN